MAALGFAVGTTHLVDGASISITVWFRGLPSRVVSRGWARVIRRSNFFFRPGSQTGAWFLALGL